MEPLHFTCCAASEATRVENMDSAAAMQSNNILDELIFETSSLNNVEAGATIHTNNIGGMTVETIGNNIEKNYDKVNAISVHYFRFWNGLLVFNFILLLVAVILLER